MGFRYTLFPWSFGAGMNHVTRGLLGKARLLLNVDGLQAPARFGAAYRRLALGTAALLSSTGLMAAYRRIYGFHKPALEWITEASARAVRRGEHTVVQRGLLSTTRRPADEFSEPFLKLMKGDLDLASYVKAHYRRESHPLLYSRGPVDLTPPAVIDGLTAHEQDPPSALGPASMQPEMFERFYDKAVRIGAGSAALCLIFWVALMLLIHSTGWVVTGSAHGVSPSHWEGLYLGGADNWGAASTEAARASASTLATVHKTLAAIFGGGAFVVGLGMALLGSLLQAHRVARQAPINALRAMTWYAAETAASTFRGDAFEPLVRRAWRMDAIKAHERSLAAAHTFAGTAETPVFHLGVATGRYWFRGALQSPLPGTPVAMSMSDVSRHLLVMGGTGGGKTSQVARPLLRRICEMRKAGLPVALYLTDGKAVLYNTLMAEAAAAGQASEVAIIGTAPGQLRVDLLDGVDPLLFADVMTSVASQLGGSRGGDSFWPRMASSLVLQTAIILQAAEVTRYGVDFATKTGKRLYSISQIIKFATEPKALLDGPIGALLSAMDGSAPDDYPAIAAFDRPSLHNAIEARIGFWENLADATKSGIWANVLDSLQLFLFDDSISAGFADGAVQGHYELVGATELFNSGKLVGTSISTTEYGAAGKLVLVMLKTLLMRHARAREIAHPKAADEREIYWRAPHSQPTDNHRVTIYLADEYQELITADTSSAYSDTSFWNVARSAGVAGVVMCQTLKALTQAIGEESTANFVGNFRSKVMLPVEDLSTMAWFSEMSGTAMRAAASGEYQTESYAAATLASGDEPALSKIELDQIAQEAIEEGVLSPLSFEFSPHNNPNMTPHVGGVPLGQHVSEVLANEMATIASVAGVMGLSGKEIKSHKIEAEDLPSVQFDQPILAIGEVKDLPFGDAIALINRAGITRADIINLTLRA